MPWLHSALSASTYLPVDPRVARQVKYTRSILRLQTRPSLKRVNHCSCRVTSRHFTQYGLYRDQTNPKNTTHNTCGTPKLALLKMVTTATMDEQTLDKTALTTISLLEARLLRIEQILYGTTSAQGSQSLQQQPADSTLSSLADLERRFSTLISRFRVYADILKLCMCPSRDVSFVLTEFVLRIN